MTEHVDTDELMRLHAATATPGLEQLCWYDVKPEQASFFEACLEDVPKLVAEVCALREELSDFETRIARQLDFNEATRLSLARVEALPAKWHQEAGDDNELGPMHSCADALKAALAGIANNDENAP